jgi:hypothetical protein
LQDDQTHGSKTTDEVTKPSSTVWRRTGKIFAMRVQLRFTRCCHPDSEAPVVPGANKQPFIWNQMRREMLLDAQLITARLGLPAGEPHDAAFPKLPTLESIARATLTPQDTRFAQIETPELLAPMIAVCASAARLCAIARSRPAAVKNQSRTWDITSLAARHRLYRLLYGSRARRSNDASVGQRDSRSHQRARGTVADALSHVARRDDSQRDGWYPGAAAEFSPRARA